MTRYGPQFGPDITFLGVPAVDVADAAALAAADVVVVGAPFDGGTSHRPGTRFGPSAIRGTDYLPHDGSRPHLALRVDGLQDLAVVDMGDVEMPPGEIERALHALEEAVYEVALAGAVPLVLGGDHSIALPDATGVARHLGFGRVSMIHFDAHADTGDAPGTGTPEPGGLSSRQLLDAVRRICRELPIAGIDVVEVSPPYDHAEITAFLANRVCLEALSGLAARRHGISHDPAGPLLEGR